MSLYNWPNGSLADCAAVDKKPPCGGLDIRSKPNEVKKDAVNQLIESGKINKFSGPIPSFVKNWARTDEEKKTIRDKMREISQDRGDKNITKKTSNSVVKDLKLTQNYAAKKYEDAKTYFDAKINKQIQG